MTDTTKPDYVYAECAHPDCSYVGRFRADTRAGEYACACRTHMLRLTWSTALDGTRSPYLTLVKKESEPES
jgi:hypothetical protein